ncbi:MAG: Ig-like domain-containing protein [Planctomycetes bacterium]|nr:Ig-like domain-containing protein [Planctomycetota bacterium]
MAVLAIGSDRVMAREGNAGNQNAELPTELPIGLQIVSPSAGTVVHAGSKVDVCVDLLPGFMPVSVLIGGPDNAAIVTEAPYTTTLSIPSEMLGAGKLWALGKDANGNRFCAEPLDIDVVTTAVVTSIATVSDEFYFTKYLSSYRLRVLGKYSDGATRDVSSASRGTTYSSDDTSIATVSAIGEMRSVRVGKTVIRAHNGQLESALPVTVVDMPLIGDLDGSGENDGRDIDMLLFHFGPCSGCEYDLDGSGEVDGADVGILLNGWRE